MTPGITEALLVAVGGGAGAMLRYGVDSLVTELARRRSARQDKRGSQGKRDSQRNCGWPAPVGIPWGIIIVNLTGSFLIGAALGAGSAVPWAATPAITVGVLGGYTTFSTASLDSLRLWREKRRCSAVIHALCTLGAAVLLAGIGFSVGARITVCVP